MTPKYSWTDKRVDCLMHESIGFSSEISSVQQLLCDSSDISQSSFNAFSSTVSPPSMTTSIATQHHINGGYCAGVAPDYRDIILKTGVHVTDLTGDVRCGSRQDLDNNVCSISETEDSMDNKVSLTEPQASNARLSCDLISVKTSGTCVESSSVLNGAKIKSEIGSGFKCNLEKTWDNHGGRIYPSEVSFVSAQQICSNEYIVHPYGNFLVPHSFSVNTVVTSCYKPFSVQLNADVIHGNDKYCSVIVPASAFYDIDLCSEELLEVNGGFPNSFEKVDCITSKDENNQTSADKAQYCFNASSCCDLQSTSLRTTNNIHNTKTYTEEINLKYSTIEQDHLARNSSHHLTSSSTYDGILLSSAKIELDSVSSLSQPSPESGQGASVSSSPCMADAADGISKIKLDSMHNKDRGRPSSIDCTEYTENRPQANVISCEIHCHPQSEINDICDGIADPLTKGYIKKYLQERTTKSILDGMYWVDTVTSSDTNVGSTAISNCKPVYTCTNSKLLSSQPPAGQQFNSLRSFPERRLHKKVFNNIDVDIHTIEEAKVTKSKQSAINFVPKLNLINSSDEDNQDYSKQTHPSSLMGILSQHSGIKMDNSSSHCCHAAENDFSQPMSIADTTKASTLSKKEIVSATCHFNREKDTVVKDDFKHTTNMQKYNISLKCVKQRCMQSSQVQDHNKGDNYDSHFKHQSRSSIAQYLCNANELQTCSSSSPAAYITPPSVHDQKASKNPKFGTLNVDCRKRKKIYSQSRYVNLHSSVK